MIADMLTSLPTTLAVEAHLVERKFLLQQQILNTENSLIYRAANQRPTVFRRERQKLEPK
jgi:hypothetical protein